MTATTVSPTVWLNGRLVDERSASVSVFDRGFLFGDGVYELIRFFRCAPGTGHRRHGVAMDLHVARLHRSLGLAKIRGFDAASLPRIASELLDANNLDDASVYLQVTRGAGPSRSHVPQAGLTPTVFACASSCEPIERFCEPQSVHAVVREDLRWKLCQIKTISLMGNILSLIDADEEGASEAILHRDGVLSEGAYTNVFVVLGDELVTPPVNDDPPILHGVTRAEILELAPTLKVRAETGSRVGTGRPLRAIVRPIRLEELRRADEILITSSRRFVSAVTMLDGAAVGNGSTGPVARHLFESLRGRVAEITGVALPANQPALSTRS